MVSVSETDSTIGILRGAVKLTFLLSNKQVIRFIYFFNS